MNSVTGRDDDPWRVESATDRELAVQSKLLLDHATQMEAGAGR